MKPNEVTLEKLRERKANLEHTITLMIMGFEKENGIGISDLNFSKEEHKIMSSEGLIATDTKYKVDIELKI